MSSPENILQINPKNICSQKACDNFSQDSITTAQGLDPGQGPGSPPELHTCPEQ